MRSRFLSGGQVAFLQAVSVSMVQLLQWDGGTAGMAIYRGGWGNKIPTYPHLRQLFPRLFPRFKVAGSVSRWPLLHSC